MSANRLLRGFAVLAVLTLLTQAIGFVAVAVAARRLGPTDLGAANFAIGVAVYFGIPANFGFTIMGIRDIAREPERAREIAAEILGIRLVLGAALTLLMLLLTPVLTLDAKTSEALPIAAATILVSGVGTEWILLGRQQALLVGLGRLLGQATYAGAIVLFLSGGTHGAALFCWFTVLSILVTAGLNQAGVWRVIGAPRVILDRKRLVTRAKQALPFGVAVIAVQIYFSIDSVMLGFFEGSAAVGEYTVAYKIPLALYGVLNLWSASLYPQSARLVEEQPEVLRSQVDVFTTLGIGLALPLAAGATVLGPELIVTLFGNGYEPAGTPFVLLTWALAIAVVTVSFGAALAAGGDERRYAWGVSLGALLNILVNLWAIPAFGTTGAAWATVASEALVVVYMVRRYRIVVGAVTLRWDRLTRAVLATAVMVGVLVALPDAVPVLVSLTLGGVVYVAAAILLGAVRTSEIASLRDRRAAPEPT